MQLKRKLNLRGIDDYVYNPPPGGVVAEPIEPKSREIDPKALDALMSIETTPYQNSFASRLTGTLTTDTKPFFQDWEARSLWMDLAEDVRMHYILMQ